MLALVLVLGLALVLVLALVLGLALVLDLALVAGLAYVWAYDPTSQEYQTCISGKPDFLTSGDMFSRLSG